MSASDAAEAGGAPRSFASLRDLLLERRATLPKRLAQVADFALDNPDDMAFGTVAAVADLAGVQPSTLVRFAQALGYEGFSDLQTVFHALLRNRWPDYEERLKGPVARQRRETSRRFSTGFCESAAVSLMRMQASASAATRSSAPSTILADAPIRSIMIGQRRAFPVASYLAYALSQAQDPLRAGRQSSASLGPDQVAFARSRATRVLAVSFAPYTPATIEMSERGCRNACPLWRSPILRSLRSPASARVWFEVAEADFGAFRAVSGTFALAMTLAVAVGQRRARG